MATEETPLDGSAERFSVDTHLFRELGRLLVGRDSTALVELIKNAYDADATVVTVHGEGLSDSSGRVTVTDNGNGMTAEQFRRGFLRIAARSRETRSRRSERFKRRYTGAKGIGRLSAHKLATRLHVQSISRTKKAGSRGLEAVIDWDEIESHETLDDLSSGIWVTPFRGTTPSSGTTITLSPLRRPWTDSDMGAFSAEAFTFRPPRAVVDRPPQDHFASPHLFGQMPIAETDPSDPGFDIELTGDFEIGESLWTQLVSTMDWLIEIDASTKLVKYRIAPAASLKVNEPSIPAYDFKTAHPHSDGPFFRARIYAHVGSHRSLSDFARRVGGVRVYMEGFRVLPYGEPTDDWLRIDSDYVRRNRTPRISSGIDLAGAGLDEREVFNILGNEQYLGAVILTERSAPQLEMLVNREGFIPGPALETVRDLVRQGIDLSLRARAAVDDVPAPVKKVSPTTRRGRAPQPAPPPKPVGTELVERLQRTTEIAREMRTTAAPVSASEVATLTSALERATDEAVAQVGELRDEQARVRVLASVGAQLAAFVHEINGMLGQAQALVLVLDKLAASAGLTARQRESLATAQRTALELVEMLTRQGSYLSDVVVNERRRRRRRHDVVERLGSATRILNNSLARREIKLTLDIQPKLKTPPMFGAETTILFTNLMTNAIKAAGQGGRIKVSARSVEGSLEIRIQNTGDSVDLADGERWFRPFETTTVDVDVVLGQGMGLGLPITRALVADYGGSVSFVKPDRGFATAVRVVIPDRARG